MTFRRPNLPSSRTEPALSKARDSRTRQGLYLAGLLPSRSLLCRRPRFCVIAARRFGTVLFRLRRNFNSLWLRFRRDRARQLLQRRQFLLQLEDRLAQVAHLLEPGNNLRGFEHQQARVLFLESAFHLLPRHRSRNRGVFACPQRVNGNGCFVLVVLAPVDKDLTGADVLLHVRDSLIRMIVLEKPREGMGKGLSRLVTCRSVQRDINLQPFRSRSLGKTLQPEMLKDLAQP